MDVTLEMTYAERMLLWTAINMLPSSYCVTDQEKEALQSLKEKIAKLECQPGGCELCNLNYKEWDE